MISNFDKDLAAVDQLYADMEKLIVRPETELHYHNQSISKWSAAEQIQHVLLANRWALSTMVAMLNDGEEFPVTGRLKPLGLLLLGFGAIPRGRGKAPAAAIPSKEMALSDLQVHLRQQKGYLNKLRAQSEFAGSVRRRFVHPMLGDFTPAHGMRFVRVHTRHHLKIVREILASLETA